MSRQDGYIRMKLHEIYIHAIYISPNIQLNEFKQRIDKVFESASINGRSSIIMGDIKVADVGLTSFGFERGICRRTALPVGLDPQ